jgi:23S rRNA G2445 N2-methylase RlmL
MPKPPPRGEPAAPAARRIEVIVSQGLEPIARAELRRLGPAARLGPHASPTLIALDYQGELRALLGLRVAQSVYMVRHFAVPRPKALLGDEHFRAMLAMIEQVRRLHPPEAFRSLFLSAAGADSAVLTRLKADLASRAGLAVGADDGDLLLRLRRAGAGWELLVRLSPRPLATRPWRICNREGALNGAVAHAMALLSLPQPDDRFLNLGCGSGSLLVERLLAGPARQAFGCDNDLRALACAKANVAAAGLLDRCALHSWDMRALPLANASVDAISADLPFGHLVGSHAENLLLYPAVLDEAARVARQGARCVLLSHEVRLMERLLAAHPAWAVGEVISIDLGGLRPRIFVLERR